jgi:hypothetical protein
MQQDNIIKKWDAESPSCPAPSQKGTLNPQLGMLHPKKGCCVPILSCSVPKRDAESPKRDAASHNFLLIKNEKRKMKN